jgi:hypothetical protein
MDKVIKIKESQIGELLEFYEDKRVKNQAKISEAKALVESLLREERQIIDMIKNLKIDIQPNPSSASIFPIRGSWWEKIFWVLNTWRKVMTAVAIGEFIFKHESSITEEERKLAAVNIFATLSNKSKNNKISRIKTDGEFLYGLNEWFDANGNLIPEFDDN